MRGTGSGDTWIWDPVGVLRLRGMFLGGNIAAISRHWIDNSIVYGPFSSFLFCGAVLICIQLVSESISNIPNIPVGLEDSAMFVTAVWERLALNYISTSLTVSNSLFLRNYVISLVIFCLILSPPRAHILILVIVFLLNFGHCGVVLQ